MSATNTLSAKLIGAIFLERGLVTEEQLQAALAMQNETKEHLGEILVQHFGVSRIELASVLAEQWAELEKTNASSSGAGEQTAPSTVEAPEGHAVAAPKTVETEHGADEGETEERRPLGEIFVEQGLVTDEELDQALETQKRGGERLGEILVAQGSITRLQLASALADQWTTLRKIRPPSSSEPAAAAAPAGTPREVPSEEVDRLREAVSAIEQRLRAAESVTAREPWREEISTAAEDLQRAVSELEGRLAVAPTREDLAAVDDLRASLGELAERVEGFTSSERTHEAELIRRVESAANAAEAAKSGLGGAFESLSLRLADVESRVHDRSDITTLQTELSELVERVGELAGSVPSTETDKLRDEVQRLQDEVTRRAAVTAEGDPELVERVAALTGRVDETAAALQKLEGEAGPSPEQDALKDAVATLAARVEELEGHSPDLEAIRRTLAELEARPEVDSALAERLSHYGVSSPEEIRELQDRLEEVERHAADLVQGTPELDEQIRGLTSRLHALESGDTGAGLAELRRAMDELASRPSGDPTLAEQVKTLASELQRGNLELDEQIQALTDRMRALESGETGAELAELRRTLDDLSARPAGDPALAEKVERLASELAHGNPELDAQLQALTSRLHALESGDTGTEVAELRRALDELADRPAGNPALAEQVARLASELAETSGLRSQLEELRGELSDLAGRTYGLGTVTAEVEALRSQFEQVSSRLDETSSSSRELDDLRDKIDTLSSLVAARADDVVDVRPELEELRSDLEALAGRTSGFGSVADEVEVLRLQLGRLDDFGARLQEVETGSATMDELRTRLDDLSTRPAGDPELVEQLTRRVEAVSGASRELEELRARVDTLSAQAGAPNEDLATLRGEMSELGHRLDSVTDRTADSVPAEQIQTLADRVRALEADDPGAELAELRRVVDELPARPAGDPALAERVERLGRKLDEATNVGPQLEQLRSEVDELIRAGEEARTETSSRLDEVTGELRRAVERLGTRVEAVEEVAAERRSDDHDARIDRLESRLDERASREDAFGERIEDVAARVAGLDELRARLDDLGGRFGEHEDRHAKSVRKADLSALRSDLTEKLENLDRRLEELAVDAKQGRESSTRKLEKIVTALQSDVDGHRAELGDRVEAAEHDAAALRDELTELRGAAEANEAWRSDAEADLHRRVEKLGRRLESDLSTRHDDLAPALVEVQGELSSLSSRLDHSDATTAQALDELKNDLEEVVRSSVELLQHIERADMSGKTGELGTRVEKLERRFEAEAARGDAQVEATEEALRAGLTALGERLAATESTYIEAGSALRRSIERLGAAIVDADGLVAERARGEAVVEAQTETAGPFLAFVPNGKGYGLQELNGRAPVVGEPISVVDDDGEFVVTRVGRSPLPLDRRRCVYLERRGQTEPSPDRVT